MAALSTFRTISPGEPFDLAYISEIADYINNFNTIIKQYDTNMVNLNNQLTSMKKTKIVTKKILVSATGIIKKGDQDKHIWSTDYSGTTYKYTPSVTATPLIGTVSDAANSCWLTTITTSRVSGRFAFNEGPFNDEKVYIELIIIGIIP